MCDEEPKLTHEEWEQTTKLERSNRADRVLIVIGIASCYWFAAKAMVNILIDVCVSVNVKTIIKMCKE